MYHKILLYLSLAGTLFSGYLSGRKLFTNSCAFNETCPYFWGYPACWFGFGLFFILFIIAVLGVTKIITLRAQRASTSLVSLLGVLFAGQFVIDEVKLFLERVDTNYSLILPTCAYGLIFFLAIFITSLWPKASSTN